jgi:phage shock protein E
MNKNTKNTIYILVAFLTLVVIVSIILYLVKYAYGGKYLISSERAVLNIKNKKYDIIVDVRTPTEYMIGNYPGSVNIPINSIKTHQHIEDQIPDKKSKILIYCNTGQRARYASELLKKKGYENIEYIAGSHLTLMQ